MPRASPRSPWVATRSPPAASVAATIRRTPAAERGRAAGAGSEMSPIVAITGASAGVGRATARAFARDGWDVALLARGAAGLDAAADEIRAAGARALPIAVDVADAEAVQVAGERIERELGPIDAWVNNAMESAFAP